MSFLLMNQGMFWSTSKSTLTKFVGALKVQPHDVQSQNADVNQVKWCLRRGIAPNIPCELLWIVAISTGTDDCAPLILETWTKISHHSSWIRATKGRFWYKDESSPNQFYTILPKDTIYSIYIINIHSYDSPKSSGKYWTCLFTIHYIIIQIFFTTVNSVLSDINYPAYNLPQKKKQPFTLSGLVALPSHDSFWLGWSSKSTFADVSWLTFFLDSKGWKKQTAKAVSIGKSRFFSWKYVFTQLFVEKHVYVTWSMFMLSPRIPCLWKGKTTMFPGKKCGNIGHFLL